jgi:hypothetical protein
MAVWIEGDPRQDVWLLSPVSPLRFKLLRSGQLELRVVFASPEDGFVFRVTSTEMGVSVEPALPDSLSDEELPEIGQTLIVASAELPDSEVLHVPAGLIAKQAWRPTLDIRLKLPERYGQRVPARALGKFLIPLQDTMDAIVYGRAVDLATRGQLPSGLLSQTEISMQSSYGGSFGIVLTSTEQADLFGNSSVTGALKQLANLIECGSNPVALRNALAMLHFRAASRYARLLKSLSRLNAGIGISWGSPIQGPEDGKRETSMSAAIVKDALTIVSEAVLKMPEEVLVVGELVGLNVRTRAFEIKELSSGRRYSGQIAVDAPGTENATIKNVYTARIEKVIEVSTATDAETTHWLLIGLLPPPTTEINRRSRERDQ